VRLLEILAISSLPAVLGLVLPDSGIAGTMLRLLVPMPVVAGFYGLGWGFASGAIALAEALVIRLAFRPGFAGLDAAVDGMGVVVLASPVVLSLAGTFFIAFARSRIILFRARLLDRFRSAVHGEVALRKQNDVLEKVNLVLESRVSSQRDSITLLHDQVRKLASLNLEQALKTILETVAQFTGMTAGVIWTLDEEKKHLVPVAEWGWSADEIRDVTLDPETTIEGYVLRNRKPFSVRMLMDNAEFDRFDSSRTILTLPIIIGAKSWGVLSVEDIPFERYSQYTETILAVLLSLSEPYLRQITEYETLNSQNEVDPETGRPLFSILYKTLESDLERFRHEPGFVSLVIVEISNYSDLTEKWSREQVKNLLFSLKDDIDKVKSMKSKAFHFKEDSQLVLLVYDLDQDGTSFFCLDLLAMFSGYHFDIGEERVPVELIIGFSSSSQSGASVDSMIDTADHLLSIQRL
jgi:hypothetical protein